MSCAALCSRSSAAARSRLALEQLGALERERGEPGEDLGDAQLLGTQRRARRRGGHREHAERAAERGLHRTGDERRDAIPRPRRLGGRLVELLAQPRAQGAGAPAQRLDVADQQRLAALDRRLRDAAAGDVVGAVEDGLHGRADLRRLEPGRRRADVPALPVDRLKGAAVDVEQHAHLRQDLLERVAQPDRGRGRVLDAGLCARAAHPLTIAARGGRPLGGSSGECRTCVLVICAERRGEPQWR